MKVGDWVIFSSRDLSDLRCGTGQVQQILGRERASVRWDIEGDPMPSICAISDLKEWRK